MFSFFKKGKRFMTNCICSKELVKYSVEDEWYDVYIDKNNTLKYKGFYCKCGRCGRKLYVDSIEEINQKQFEEAYKRHYDIIPLTRVKAMLKRYGINAENFAKVVGIEKELMLRWISGKYIIKPEISELFKEYDNSVEKFLQRLMDHNIILTRKTYLKSLKACLKIMEIEENK